MIFKDVDDKDLGLNIMRCASLKYAQILPIKYLLSLSVTAERKRNKGAVGVKDERVRKAMLMWPLETSKDAGRDPGGQARWPGLSPIAFWACPSMCCL